MKKIIINPDQSKSYYFASEAIEDLGYEPVGKLIFTRQFKKVEVDAFEKDGILYAYRGMESFNTTIYKIYLGLVSSLKGNYEIVER